jgi:hypothetical protein
MTSGICTSAWPDCFVGDARPAQNQQYPQHVALEAFCGTVPRSSMGQGAKSNIFMGWSCTRFQFRGAA